MPWERPVVGRPGSLVEPGDRVSLYISDEIFAGHAFGLNYDGLVDKLTAAGFPDFLVNIPTMPISYFVTYLQEMSQGAFRQLSKVPQCEPKQ